MSLTPDTGRRKAAASWLAPDSPPVGIQPTPAATDRDAHDDFAWFDQRPGRLFRARIAPGGLWLVRRRRSVLLRTFRPQQLELPLEDSDGEIGPLWFATAWLETSNRTAGKRARAAGVRRGRQS
jgi:hypothetical protein